MSADAMSTAPTGRSVYLLALLFGSIGVIHFVSPEFFDRIVPAWVPNARMATYLSGVAEIAGAIGLLIPATRVAAGWGLIALLVAVFPANINMLQMARASADSSTGYLAALWIRLPFQPLLAWWIWSAVLRSR